MKLSNTVTNKVIETRPIEGNVTTATFSQIPGNTPVEVSVQSIVMPALGGVGGFKSQEVGLGEFLVPGYGES